MGACCSKFGNYFVRKDDTFAVAGNGSTPKLKNLKHQQSFNAATATPDKTESDKTEETKVENGHAKVEKKKSDSSSSSSSSSSSDDEAEKE